MKRDRILKARLKEQVLVTLVSGETFSGVFYDFDERALVLWGAEAVSGDGARTKADGVVLLMWSNVRFVQKP